MNSFRPIGSREWKRFKREALEDLRRNVTVALELMDGGTLRAELRRLRRQHHLVVIADRIGRSALDNGRAPPADLMEAAEAVLEKRGHGSQDTGSGVRNVEEERMLASARVRWHKLVRGLEANSRQSSGADSPTEAQSESSSGTAGLDGLHSDLHDILRVIASASTMSLRLGGQLHALATRLEQLESKLAQPGPAGRA